MSSTVSDYNRGIYYEACAWTFSGLATIAVATRLYTRCFLTRTAGYDDLFIIVALCLTLAGNAGDSLAVHYGLGQHEQFLSQHDYQLAQKWVYINFMLNFVCLFTVRASVMIFVLRLLPKTKRWPFIAVYTALAINLIVSLFATITYGIKCVPFNRIWDKSVPGHCLAPSIASITLIVNGALSCFTDFVTAFVPIFLLLGVRMRRKTKIVLYIIFLLGLLTASCSIGRAATVNKTTFQYDVTWRLIPTYMCGLFEEKCGIIIACLPAIRQLVVQINRHGFAGLRANIPTTTVHTGSGGGMGSTKASALKSVKASVSGRKSHDTLATQHKSLLPMSMRSKFGSTKVDEKEARQIQMKMQEWNGEAFLADSESFKPEGSFGHRESDPEHLESTPERRNSDVAIELPDITGGGNSKLRKTEGPPMQNRKEQDIHKAEDHSHRRERSHPRNIHAPREIQQDTRYTLMEPNLIPGSPITQTNASGRRYL